MPDRATALIVSITPPSLYTTFGDKKQLFLEAVQRYVSGPVSSESTIAEAPRHGTQQLVCCKQPQWGFTGKNNPSGCLHASSAISCSPAAADVQRELSDIRLAIEESLRKRIELENNQRNAKRKIDAELMASYVMALIQGMSTLARDGAGRPKLMKLIEAAMKVWPI